MELDCYELIGLASYYLGNIKDAFYFHSRYVEAKYESDISPMKLFSADNLSNFILNVEFKF